MDTKKASTLLAKITSLQQTISFDPDNVSTIEKNLMLSYLQELYDVYHFMGDSKNVSNESVQKNTSYNSQPPQKEETIAPPPVKETPKKVAPTLPENEQKALEELYKYAPSEEARRNPRVVQAGFVETKPARPAKKIVSPVEINIPQSMPQQPHFDDTQEDKLDKLFESKQPNELSERLSQAPITDLTKAMGINEKILNINELFDGDQQAFDIALQKLNSFKSYRDAQKYMSQELATRYDWSDKSRVSKAQQFVNLVKRRYS